MSAGMGRGKYQACLCGLDRLTSAFRLHEQLATEQLASRCCKRMPYQLKYANGLTELVRGEENIYDCDVPCCSSELCFTHGSYTCLQLRQWSVMRDIRGTERTEMLVFWCSSRNNRSNMLQI